MGAEQTDRELLTLWAAGDALAGERLVRRHLGAVYGFFRNKLDDGVDDIVQRTFLGCVQALPRFRQESSFRTFLFAIARNQLLMFFRAKTTAKETPLDPETSVFDLGVRQGALFAGATTQLEARREQVLLLRALRKLSVDDQIALELFYWENLSGEDIAEVLGRPHATVRTRLRRARVRLDELIRELGDDAGLVTSTADGFDNWIAAVRAAYATR